MIAVLPSMIHPKQPFSDGLGGLLKNKKEKSCKSCDLQDSVGGERGIRTPGTSQYAGFQDRCIRPLCHLSNVWMPIDVVLLLR